MQWRQRGPRTARYHNNRIARAFFEHASDLSTAFVHSGVVPNVIHSGLLEHRRESCPAPEQPLETFPNPAPRRDYLVHIEVPEFTCLCPLTGQPDFATLVFDYIPDKLNVELKSLKLYIW